MPQQSFRGLGVSAPVADALAARSIHEPFEIQSLVLPDALAGLDVLAKSPTGSGKTLAFALPIVERVEPRDGKPSALVLVPTRELAQQVTEELSLVGKPKGLRVAAVYGGVPLRSQAAKAREAHIVVATPGRLEDLAERKMLALDRIRILVLDEADRMLDMGFKPQVDRIVRRIPRERQTMLFSATLDGEVGELARSYTRNPGRFEAQPPERGTAGEIEHRFVAVTTEGKVDALIKELEAERGLALVFVRTKRGADRLAAKLVRRGVPGAVAGATVVVATVVAGRATSTLIGLCRNCSVMRRISGGMVAVKNSVWRVNGTSLQMRSMSGMKPMSSMRSASSMTRSSTPVRRSRPRSKWSSSRPGVAMRTSTPRVSLVSWSSNETPPITNATLSFCPAPYFSKLS